MCMRNSSPRGSADLLEQDVSDPLDEIVLMPLWPGRAVPALLHGGEEGVVEEEQLVQAGEDPLHRLRVQLHLFPHPPAEHLGHDVQRLQVVELRLHQLCRKKTQLVLSGDVVGRAQVHCLRRFAHRR